MKAKLVVMIASIGLLFANYTFADCGASQSTCNQQVYCDSVRGPCQCANPGYNKYHSCISEQEYCDAFGNVGEM